ncbi:hypothetical protein FSS13T_02790 [Flavobacterium saliperosum S13]|uniref:Nucleotide-diphospho-sugar transferase n=3 Tax=Flavobacterium saliperosum TaxID=329186 RepID=A0A1G4V4Y8_9FLAO|nr:hypothetical protein FSS13T_02790 [Flavobacterium saliperosum S13]SCX01243.1 hypothetical protein SAMN02927925_00291 [Flavobacterium saliperosum]
MKLYMLPKKKYLMYISLNNEKCHYEVICSILSFKKTNRFFFGKIIIYTDDVTFFKEQLPYFHNVVFEFVDLTVVNEVHSRYGNLFRLKIVLIIEFLKKYRASVLFMDSDTFFIKNVNELFKYVNNGNCILHCQEYHLSSGVNANFERLLVNENLIDFFKENNTPLTGDTIVWNSGVIGICFKNIDLLTNALEIFDVIEASSVNDNTIEQLSLSIAFSKTAIIPAHDFIFHYWFIKVFRCLLWKYFFKNQDLLILNKEEQIFVNTGFVRELLKKEQLTFSNSIGIIFTVVNNYYSKETRKNIKKNFCKNTYMYKRIFL